jgi:hypothetical protein
LSQAQLPHVPLPTAEEDGGEEAEHVYDLHAVNIHNDPPIRRPRTDYMQELTMLMQFATFEDATRDDAFRSLYATAELYVKSIAEKLNLSSPHCGGSMADMRTRVLGARLPAAIRR